MVDFLMAGLFTWLAARAVDLLRDLSSWLTWLFTSPDVTILPQVQTIASRATMVVNTCYIVAIIVAGIIVMVSSSVQVRYTVKDFIPRLIVAFGLSNFALPMCSALIELANAVTVTMVDESAPTSQATTMVLAHLLAASTDPNSGFVVVIIGWLIVVLFYSLTVTWIVRVATLVIVAGIGPAAMACYCLPYTQPAAALWWRSLLGSLGAATLQALAFTTGMALITDPTANLPVLLGPPGTGFTNLLLIAVLLWVTVRIPKMMRRYVTRTNSSNPAGIVLRTVLIQAVTRNLPFGRAVRTGARALTGGAK